MLEGFTYEEHSLLVTKEMAWHSSFEVFLKAVHNLLQPIASIPEGPPAPDVWRAATRIHCASMAS